MIGAERVEEREQNRRRQHASDFSTNFTVYSSQHSYMIITCDLVTPHYHHQMQSEFQSHQWQLVPALIPLIKV